MLTDALHGLRRQARTLLNLALPPMCPTCGERLRLTDQGMCDDCWGRIRMIRRPLCPRCGLGGSAAPAKCPGCLTSEVHHTRARQAVVWEEPLSTAIHHLKYGGVTELAEPMARLVARMLVRDFPSERWDLILPVPLHRVRLRERGHNQSALIARQLGRKLGWPVDERILLRHRWTGSQTRLGRAERLINVAGAFRCRAPERVRGKRVLLLDDVHTTGSTINESAQPLVEAGAAEIFAVCVTRATM